MKKTIAALAMGLGMWLGVAAGAQAAAPAAQATGSWKVVGDVQGVPVMLTCTFAQTDLKVSGSCVDMNNKAQPLAGTVKGLTVAWAFNSEYEGTPITITLTGVVDETGTKMSGTIGVDPMGVDGTFSAMLQPVVPAAAVPSAGE